jgi:N-terminal domain of anti-restriction factor ArdC
MDGRARQVVEVPSRDELRSRVKAHLESLAQAVDATRRDAGFAEALRNMARFWRYSVMNQAYVVLQRPDATRVAGRRTWESLGRKVKPGEEPIVVLAPSRRGDGPIRFVPVDVYDVRQTRGRRLRDIDLTLQGRTRHWIFLERAAKALDVDVEYVTLPDGIKGRSLGGVIEIVPGMAGRERASVLAHELAHEVLHQAEDRRRASLKRPGPTRTHAEVETEAEATSYVVMAVMGLPSKAPTYIAWQGGTGLGVLRSMNRIQRAVKVILEAGLYS